MLEKADGGARNEFVLKSSDGSATTGTGTSTNTSTGIKNEQQQQQQQQQQQFPLPPLKQIRFVNNEGQPPPKRRRINAACRTCRKRKTRCDGKRPICSTCAENGHECLGYADGEGEAEKIGTSVQVSGQGMHRERRENERPRSEKKEIVDEDYTGGHNNASSREESRRESRRQDSKNSSGTGHLGSRNSLRRRESKSGAIYDEYKESAVYSDADTSPPIEHSHTQSHRVPYFRYFGPTAIVPGFKQMVVSVREHRRSIGAASAISMSPQSNSYGAGSAYGANSSIGGTETRANVDMPVYDQNDHLPVNRLIIQLVETFFAHLGSNFPFLQQKNFLQRVEEKSAEPILVDAVCGLAARFSDHPMLAGPLESHFPKSEYGHFFAQRAKAAVVDTFPCPTVAAVQACLLLAYEGFGANQDSALWMYLGCAIRMAVDLGLQKLDGVRYQGQKDGHHRSSNDSSNSERPSMISAQEKREVEQEKIDTLWAVFMLDRVISSGTGRPVTLRDEDFELNFPEITTSAAGGWPNPFPALIQIIHLYGRVSDLQNNIRFVHDVTAKKIEGLSSMERDLTLLYQKLDQRLTFNAANFQHYVKTGDGTNFILVHFWFHTLIMLLHQPTLMHSLEGQIIQLLPNSRELSMSSAKTIADILAFAELIDPRSCIGNPFTSQPMYIAACAFLMESAAHTISQPTSRDVSPPPTSAHTTTNQKANPKSYSAEQKQKHTLLASAANQNYQRCYKALQQLETYWAGTRYILVALDQKAKGIWDPETYTEKEYESTKLRPGGGAADASMIPRWRGKVPLSSPAPPRFRSPRMDIPGSPAGIDPSQALGWSLTGTTNSPRMELMTMWQQSLVEQHPQPQPQPPSQAPTTPQGNMIYDPIRNILPESSTGSTPTTSYTSRATSGGGYTPFRNQNQNQREMLPPPPSSSTGQKSSPTDSPSRSDAEMLLGLQYHSPYTSHSQSSPQHQPSFSPQGQHMQAEYHFLYPNSVVGDMLMQSQEIDMSCLGELGGDMMPWLEYLPVEVMGFFDHGQVQRENG